MAKDMRSKAVGSIPALNMPDEIKPPDTPRAMPSHFHKMGLEHLASVEQWLKAPSKKTRKHDLYLELDENRPVPADAAQTPGGRPAVKQTPSK